MNLELQERESGNLSPTPLANSLGISRDWAIYLQAAILLILICLLYSRSAASLIRQWFDDPDYSHGMFVPISCGFLLWITRKSWYGKPREPSVFGLFFALAAMGMLVVGTLGAEVFLPRASLVVLLGALLVYFAGWSMFRAVMAPWLALFLMIPLPVIIFNQFALPLQFLASSSACTLLDLLQVPVMREGNIIMLPSMSLDVVEACSGLRSLMSLITVAVLYGLFFERRVWMRCLLVFLAIPVAVVANALRIVLSAILAQYVNAQLAEGFFHAFSGFLLFLLSFGVLAGFQAASARLARRRMAT